MIRFDRLLAFDVETTGVNAHADRIVTAAIVDIRPGQEPDRNDWLVNPGVPIPDEATAVHGFTTDDATRYGSDPAQVCFEISMLLARAFGQEIPVVAANAAYDLTMLETENQRHDVPTLVERLDGPIAPVIDPMVLDKHADPYRKVKGGCVCGCGAVDKTLTGLCLHYGIPLDDAHTAGADATAAGRLAVRVLQAWPEVFGQLTLAGLHRGQIAWRADQMNSLRRYFDRNRIEHDGCDPSWPLLTPPPVAPPLDRPLDGVA